MDILEHLGMKVPDIEGHGVIISRASTVPMALGDRAIFVIKISRPTCNDRLSVDIIVVTYHM